MRKHTLLLVGLAALTGGRLRAEGASKPEASQTMAWLQFVAAEVRELRRELLEDRLDRQETRVRALERELRQAHVELQDGEEIQRAQSQELVQVDQRLGDLALPPEERSQLEELRTSVSLRSHSDRGALTQKAAQIGEQLQRERARLEALRALARSLAPPANESQR